MHYISGDAHPQARKPRRLVRSVSLWVAVLLAHGVLLFLMAHYTERYPAGMWKPLRPDTVQIKAERLVVVLLPTSSAVNAATQPVRSAARHMQARDVPTNSQFERNAPSPLPSPSPAPSTIAAAVAQAPLAGISPPEGSSAPAYAASGPVLRLDDSALRRALADADKGTVRGLFKSAGRLEELEPVRPDRLAVAIAGAGVNSFGDLARARIAKDKGCKQELGKSGVGQTSYGNDRDVFMSSYIGVGRDCKK